jgi:hypothetical protein
MGLFETAIAVCGVLIVIQGIALGINGLVLLSWGGASTLFAPEAVDVLSVEVMLCGPLMWRYFW